MRFVIAVLLIAVLAAVTKPHWKDWQESLSEHVGWPTAAAQSHHGNDDNDDDEEDDDGDDDDEDEMDDDDDDDHDHKRKTHAAHQKVDRHQPHASGKAHHPQHKIVVTSPLKKDVVLTQRYVCQIRSCRHIEMRALTRGYLQEIAFREGQTVRKGDVLFKILPTLYQAKLDADIAEQDLAQVEYDNTLKLMQQNIVSEQELKLARAKLAKAAANVKLAQAEVDFTVMRSPFDGIVDRLLVQTGSLIEEGAVLTTLSDNSVMWAYFNVPEVRYLELPYARGKLEDHPQRDVQLQLANHQLFPYLGKIGAIEADFDYETGNIPIRADFPNPDRLLRHGQTGNVIINQIVEQGIVIPQRATYEILAKRYVFVVDPKGIVHQREITILDEQDDIYIISQGVTEKDRIILEGIRQVRDGERIQYVYLSPDQVLLNLKYHAE